jgi:hypothetical protein
VPGQLSSFLKQQANAIVKSYAIDNPSITGFIEHEYPTNGVIPKFLQVNVPRE